MEISIIPGTMDHADECREAFLDSEVGSRYRERLQSNERFYHEGIEKREIHVAINGENEFIGFTWFIPSGTFYHFPYLRQIAVKSKYRNSGIGSRLLDYFEEQAFQQASKAFLLVSDFNENAKNLYLSRGYQEVGMLPEPFLSGINEYILMKSK